MNGPGDLARILKRELVREPRTNAGFFQVTGVRPGDHLAGLRGGFVEPMPVARTGAGRSPMPLTLVSPMAGSCSSTSSAVSRPSWM